MNGGEDDLKRWQGQAQSGEKDRRGIVQATNCGASIVVTNEGSARTPVPLAMTAGSAKVSKAAGCCRRCLVLRG